MNAFRLMRGDIVEFQAAWRLQREIAEAVRDGAPPVLLLLQHAPVITLGKRADESNILDAGPVPVVRIDRGGDVTWHGPGQLMIYPILRLRDRQLGVRTLVRRLEESIVATLAHFGIASRFRDDCVGVWTGRGKIASLGLRVARGVSMHGAALNVCNDPAAFASINPCGVPGCEIATVSAELGRRIGVDEVVEAFVPRFSATFSFDRWMDAAPSFACGRP